LAHWFIGFFVIRGFMPTYTKDQARAYIADLVAQFEQNEATLLKTEEANIENVFVRPLFRFLNWNVDNTGLSEPQWEFVLQRTTREGSRPDYVLQLDGQHLFVMDAKKARYDMHDPRWLNQVYAYAYSTQNNSPARKIDFAILTDFQEFVVLDCTLHAAKPDVLKTFYVLDWRYPDYVARFDELWELFERNNVLTTSRERAAGIFSCYLSPKQVKANRIPPDKAFLSALDDEKTGWRVRLAKDMKRLNSQTTGDVLTAAVQLLIDRLVFVKVLSDREIEEDYLARMAEIVERDGLAENDCGWFVACQNLFGELNQMYNGSVFAPREELERVRVSNKVVRGIIGDLLPENSPYNFAVLPVEILGTIYERFLGRVVHATDARVKIEDKPEVRKAGGVYYTPQYIVNYIVQNTVGKLLADCKTPADVARLKILDPACGSGSFLLGAYDALLTWHKAYYATEDGRRKTGEKIRHPSSVIRRSSNAYYLDDDGRVRLTAKLKRQILLNNLFGVDIDPQAVEVTRLSLSLKALEETRSDEAHHERTLFNQTLLPDLSANIKCGNSLIGTDYICVDDAELKRVKPFDWAREFPGIFDRRDAENAEEKTGFDAVIGNPPYVRQELLGDTKKYFEQNYAAYHGTADLYAYFIERGVSLLKPNGVFGFIVANKWMRTNYGEPLRRWMKQQRIEEITDFGDLPVFTTATTYPCILILRKDAPRTTFLATQVETLEFDNLADYANANRYTVNQTNLADGGWSLSNQGAQALLEKLRAAGIPLEEYAHGKVYYGLKTGLNQAFVIDEATRQKLIAADTKSAELIKPFLIGREIKHYGTLNPAQYLVLMPRGWTREISKNARDAWKWLQKNYPAIAEHLAPFAADAEKRYDKGEYWWELRTCDYYAEFEKPKIIYPNICQRPEFTFDTAQFFTNQKCFIIPGDDKYFLGILNSTVMNFLFTTLLPKLRGGFYEPSYVFFKNFPVRAVNFSDPADRERHDRVVALVEQMLDLHKRLHAAQTQTDKELYQRQIDATDKQIDALVYELYGLTEQEIRIVEGK
jgi:hypothetical protein